MMGKIADTIYENLGFDRRSEVKQAEKEIINLINPGCFPAGFETTMESDKYDREYAKGWNDCRIAFAENLAKLKGK